MDRHHLTLPNPTQLQAAAPYRQHSHEAWNGGTGPVEPRACMTQMQQWLHHVTTVLTTHVCTQCTYPLPLVYPSTMPTKVLPCVFPTARRLQG